mmetsp:Transcript_21300/g.50411  ORF Transcript_21300/g.50411 Transcript_21300/m.50411 type:complete len:118 (+) Transcript_21300:339-692(+)
MDGWTDGSLGFTYSLSRLAFLWCVVMESIQKQDSIHASIHSNVNQSIKSNQIKSIFADVLESSKSCARVGSIFSLFTLPYHTLSRLNEATTHPSTHPTTQPPFHTNYTHARTQIILL